MLKRITPPEDYPIQLDELKAHLAYDGEDHDERLEAMLASATDILEQSADRSFVPTVWEYVRPCLRSQIYLPKPPLVSVAWVKYYDRNNVLQTIDSANYYVLQPWNQPGRIEFKQNYSVDTFARPDAVAIRFTAGYETVPDNVKHAIKVICGWLDNDREGYQDKLDGLDRLIWSVQHASYS